MNVSLHSYAFGPVGKWVPVYLLDEAIRRTAKLGFSGIELGAIRPHAWPYDLDEAQRKSIKKLAKENNLDLPCVCGYFFGLNLCSPIKREREDATDYLVKCVELCADLEVRVLLAVPGYVVYGTHWEEAWEMSLSCMNRVTKRAEEMGVIIAIEFVNSMWSNLVTNSYQARKMMKELNSRNVKLLLDSAHAFYGGENLVDVVRFFGDDLVHVHITDCITGAPETRITAGQGDVDLVSFIESLSEIGYKEHLTLEMWGPQPEKYARESLEYIGGLLRRFC